MLPKLERNPPISAEYWKRMGPAVWSLLVIRECRSVVGASSKAELDWECNSDEKSDCISGGERGASLKVYPPRAVSAAAAAAVVAAATLFFYYDCIFGLYLCFA